MGHHPNVAEGEVVAAYIDGPQEGKHPATVATPLLPASGALAPETPLPGGLPPETGVHVGHADDAAAAPPLAETPETGPGTRPTRPFPPAVIRAAQATVLARRPVVAVPAPGLLPALGGRRVRPSTAPGPVTAV